MSNKLDHKILTSLGSLTLFRYLDTFPSHVDHVMKSIDLNSKLNELFWVKLLKRHPLHFNGKYDYSKLKSYGLLSLLSHKFDLYKTKVDMSLLTGNQWVNLLNDPELPGKSVRDECDVNLLTPSNWCQIIINGNCPWKFIEDNCKERFNSNMWLSLLLNNPANGQFRDDIVSLREFSSDQWTIILCADYSFISYYNKYAKNLMTKDNWISCFLMNHETINNCPIMDSFNSTDIAKMIAHGISIDLIPNFNWNNFTKEEWDIIKA